jgi:hypothetical protein
MPQTHATPTAAPARPQLGHSRRATHAGQYRAAKSPQELAEMRAAFSLSEALLISSDALMDDGRRVLSPECQRAVNAARACAPTAASQWLGVILAHSARFKTTACTNQVVRDGCCRYEVEPKYFGCLFSHGPWRDMRRDPLVHYYEPCVPRPEPRAPPSLPRGDRARTHARSPFVRAHAALSRAHPCAARARPHGSRANLPATCRVRFDGTRALGLQFARAGANRAQAATNSTRAHALPRDSPSPVCFSRLPPCPPLVARVHACACCCRLAPPRTAPPTCASHLSTRAAQMPAPRRRLPGRLRRLV